MDDLEVHDLWKKLITRLKEFDNYKRSGSVKEGEIEKLQEKGLRLQGGLFENLSKLNEECLKPHSKKKITNVKQLNRVVADIESLKIDMKRQIEYLDKCEERFQKYNIPKRYQNKTKQPLNIYVQRLNEFMESTWRKQTKMSRAKGYFNLIELMRMIDLKNPSNKDGLFAFTSLKNSLFKLGTKISTFLIDYVFLLVVASNASHRIVSLSLSELKTVIECLSLEGKICSSLAMSHVVLMVEFFIKALDLEGPLLNSEKSVDKGGDRVFYLSDEIEDYVVHHIIIEVLRFEVSFCSPDFPMMLTNDVLFSMSRHLVDNVFEEKLKKVEDVITVVRKYVIQFEYDHLSKELKCLRKVLGDGVHGLWTQQDPIC
ncbi:hypothetical protein CsatA_014428 [Cannabis sativa]